MVALHFDCAVFHRPSRAAEVFELSGQRFAVSLGHSQIADHSRCLAFRAFFHANLWLLFPDR